MTIGLDGVASGIRYVPSPNCDERPAPGTVSLLVIHSISLPPGEYGGDCVERFFINRLDADAHPYFDALREVRVSAHFFVRRDGEVIQFVPVGRRAWHAGASAWRGRAHCNDFSVGVELEGLDDDPTSLPSTPGWPILRVPCASQCRCSRSRRTATSHPVARPIPARCSTGRASSASSRNPDFADAASRVTCVTCAGLLLRM